jgi:hypothetical protein
VPHLWWRLGGRPYAALVFGAETFDGLAWNHSPADAVPVVSLAVDGQAARVATGRSHARLQRPDREGSSDDHR